MGSGVIAEKDKGLRNLVSLNFSSYKNLERRAAWDVSKIRGGRGDRRIREEEEIRGGRLMSSSKKYDTTKRF